MQKTDNVFRSPDTGFNYFIAGIKGLLSSLKASGMSFSQDSAPTYFLNVVSTGFEIKSLVFYSIWYSSFWMTSKRTVFQDHSGFLINKARQCQ